MPIVEGAASAMLVVSRLASGWITTGERPITEFDRAPGPTEHPFESVYEE